MKAFLHRLAAAGVLLAAVTTGASAQVLYDSNGWESSGTPAFVIGPLCDTSLMVPYQQDGWTELSAGFDGVNNPITGATLLGSINVTPASGTQMHRSKSAATPPGYNFFTWKDIGAAYNARTPGNNTIVISTDIYLPSFYASSDHEHGITCWNLGGSTFLGGFTVFNSGIFNGFAFERGFILYGGGTIAGNGGVILNQALPRDTWTHVTTVLDYGNNLVECYINGVQVVFALASDNIFRTGWPMDDTPASMAPFNDADLTSYPSADPVSSSVFTDNFRVTAIRSITFNGKVQVEDVPNLEDAEGSIFALFELRDSAGNPRTGQQAIRMIQPDAGDPSLGTYSLRMHDLPNGNYKLYIKGERHLSRVIDVTVSGSGAVTVPTTTLRGGDANGDDTVNVLDLDVLIQGFDQHEGDPNFNPLSDFNYDNGIDVLDLDALIRNFDVTGEGA